MYLIQLNFVMLPSERTDSVNFARGYLTSRGSPDIPCYFRYPLISPATFKCNDKYMSSIQLNLALLPIERTDSVNFPGDTLPARDPLISPAILDIP